MHSIAELKERVEAELLRLRFNESPRDLYEPIKYMLALEAKRMRPVLVLCGCELFGGSLDDAMSPAMGMEVFHNFTLLHDDIMDNAPIRRSRPTVHTHWNSNIAILSGDTMFVKACQLMLMSPDKVSRQVMELFHRTAIEVCEGQQMDMDFEKSKDVSISEYIQMITFKTAVLLGACLETGALIAGAHDEDARHLFEFGKNIGISFQLKDDLLDVFGDDKKFGKQKGGDILANKKTFLFLKAFELAKENDLMELQEWFSPSGNNRPGKVEGVTSIYERLGVRAVAEEEMERFFNEAMTHLDSIRVGENNKQVLRDFAGRLLVREV